MRGYAYTGDANYFATICAFRMRELFGRCDDGREAFVTGSFGTKEGWTRFVGTSQTTLGRGLRIDTTRRGNRRDGRPQAAPTNTYVRPELQRSLSDARAIVRFAFPWWLRPFLIRNVIGVTLGRRIYLAREVGEEQLERFLRHELVHVRQIQQHGVLRFYCRYLIEYLANRRRGLSSAEAYRKISFEIEALASEETL